MIRPRRQVCAFTLLELLLAIGTAMVIVSVLSKLLLDGIYLQRITWERANRTAIASALTDRLRADVLGATTHTWEQSAASATLLLLTWADGARRQVQWVFGTDDVTRRVDGREAGSFRAERLGFSAQIERKEHADLLVLVLTVHPPARVRRGHPRTTSECVLLPQPSAAPADGEPELKP